MQEYDVKAERLAGPIKMIFQKPHLIEGPNLYKLDGRYYLMLAEGGTGWNHGISMARAATIDGPYEADPLPLLLTSREKSGARPLQKAGHGDWFKRPQGNGIWPICAAGRYTQVADASSGRETALQRVIWNKEGWMRLEAGGTDAQMEVAIPRGVKPHAWPAENSRDEFDSRQLGLHWCSLRVPVDETWLSLTERPGWLRMRGRESIHSLFDQSLLAKRQQSFRCTAETCLEFTPAHFSQMAGLIYWYDIRTHYFLRITHEESKGRVFGDPFHGRRKLR